MAKFHGVIGFVHTVEEPAGEFSEVPTEMPYFGDEIKGARQLVDSENLNPDLTVNASLSVVADGYLTENIFAIRYAMWRGKRWKVVTATPEGRRLLLTLGGVYRGPAPADDAP